MASYNTRMSLTKEDLNAIKKLFDTSFDERVPKIVQPMLDKLEGRLTRKIDDLTLSVGQFSLETTERIDSLDKKLNDKIDAVDAKLSDKIDEVSDKLDDSTEMADTNRVEIAKVKRKLGLT